MSETNSEVANKFVGPLLIGTILNVNLFGMCLMQAHTYSLHCQKDAQWIKYMVVWLTALMAISCALACFISYDYAVRDFGIPNKVLQRTPEFSAFILTIGLASTTTQSFYGWRVKRLLHKPWLANSIFVAAIIQMLCVIGVGTGDSIVRGFLAFQQARPIRILVYIWMSLAPVTDLFIAGLLVWFLRKSRTGFRKTDSVLNRLTILTVQTGAVTAIAAVLGLLLFLTIPDFVHLVFIFTLPELYGICLLSSLNARAAWSRSSDLVGEQTYHSRANHDPARSAIQVTTSVVMQSDNNFELSRRTGSAPVPVDLTREESRQDEGLDVKRGDLSTISADDKRVNIGDEVDFESARGDLEAQGRVTFETTGKTPSDHRWGT